MHDEREGSPAGGDPLEKAMAAALAAHGENAGPSVPETATVAPPDPFLGGMAPPASPAGYRIDLPAGFARDAELEANLRQWSHRAGLPQGVVAGIVSQYCRGFAPDSARTGGTPQALAREWGEDFPRRVALARAVLRRSGGGAELDALLNRTGLGDDPWLIRTLAALGECQPAAGGTP